jgi:4-diphosphocytidyl-2-C-methyl-D-erythritol kinase
MVVFPYCKINIGLQVTSRRPDGFHDIVTLFYPLPLHDALEVVTAGQTVFHPSGIPVPGLPEDNLCLKAHRLLQIDFPRLPAAGVWLHKSIPIGAGLGGGSSDGAFMLRLLNEKYRLGLEAPRLSEYAFRLGSDCPFFLQDGACYASGRGEKLSATKDIDLSAFHIVLVCPDVHINTAWAYSQVIPRRPSSSLAALLQGPVETWCEEVKNDFEAPVFRAYPSLAEIKKSLYEQGALYASMSGSGASLFGIFPSDTRRESLSFGEHTTFFF